MAAATGSATRTGDGTPGEPGRVEQHLPPGGPPCRRMGERHGVEPACDSARLVGHPSESGCDQLSDGVVVVSE
ncbi:hypothetical protein [Cryptosporangium sp. NPDC048952]|uniref:hypothetical protein n=1 Tax=Cryptosporangium sp. NPDC048952 TaxID=3363961 RepID=UPI00372479A1